MPATSILDYCIEQGAWEPRSHLGADGTARAWHVAAARLGGTDPHELYQVGPNGMIYHVESDDDEDDAGVATSILYETKQFDLEGVAMIHTVYVRLDPVDDVGTLTVRVSGSEYGDLERSYAIDFSEPSGEIKIRVHRNLIGRWVQLEISGNVSHRPAVHDWSVFYVPVRKGRVSS